MRFPDKVAVTGTRKGIGRAISLRLAQEEADVVIADIDRKRVHGVAAKKGALFLGYYSASKFAVLGLTYIWLLNSLPAT